MKKSLLSALTILLCIAATSAPAQDATLLAKAGGEPLAPPTKRVPAKKRETPKNGRTTPREPAPNYTTGLTRIKDIADVQGVRGNQLIGYGLVVGLEGTGDGQSALFTVQSIVNMLKKFGISVPPEAVRVKNVAAVMVTADLPAFVKPGGRIDVTVSSMGDAKSLQGGTLLQTPLRAANGDVYAAAQGALSIGGFNFGQGGSSVQKNHVAAGRIPRGAYVEQEVPTTLSEDGLVQITLRDPDFTTASRVAIAIHRAWPDVRTHATDAATVSVVVPEDQKNDLVGFLARVEIVSVTPDTPARIILNERTGTIVIGGNVRLAPGAISHGAINVKIENAPIIVPPAPFNPNPGQVVPLKDTQVVEKTTQLLPIPATSTIDQLVKALNALGVTTRDLISILQEMHSAGMIAAEIEVQ